MLKPFTAAFVSFLTLLMSVFAPTVNVSKIGEVNDFTPVLRFTAASDSHVMFAGDWQCRRVQKAIKLGYAVAAADSEYKELDAVLFAGDVTDNGKKNQFCGFVSAAKSVLRGDTELLAVLARSHDSSTLGSAGALEYFSSLTGLENDYNHVINGFHFIGISTAAGDEQYTGAQRSWLREQLENAVAEDPSKPIFVMHHEHVKNTVYGSSDFEGWGLDFFSSILDDYPQVVDFSGHSHYPVNDPRSIWQGSFTAIGTGSLEYMELTVDEDRTVHPEGYKKEAQMWIVEVDAQNRVRLRGIDIIEERVLCEYLIDSIGSPQNFEYTPAKQASRSLAPDFPNGAVATVSKSLKVSFPAAEPNDGTPVFLYRLRVENSEGDDVFSDYLLPKYYSATLESTLSYSLGSLEKGSYTVFISAETAYGVGSAPLTASFSVS